MHQGSRVTLTENLRALQTNRYDYAADYGGHEAAHRRGPRLPVRIRVRDLRDRAPGRPGASRDRQAGAAARPLRQALRRVRSGRVGRSTASRWPTISRSTSTGSAAARSPVTRRTTPRSSSLSGGGLRRDYSGEGDRPGAADSPTRAGCGCRPICAMRCTTHRPNCRNRIRETTSKAACHQPIPLAIAITP